MSATKKAKKRVVRKQIKAKQETKKEKGAKAAPIKKSRPKSAKRPAGTKKRSPRKRAPKKSRKSPKSRKSRNLRPVRNAPPVKTRRKRKLSPAKEKKKRERRKLFLQAMDEDRFEDVRDMLDRTRRDGTEAMYPSSLRHLGDNTDRALSRLRKAAGEKGHETAKFREEAEFLSEFFQVSIREVYTLWFSP